MTPKRPYEFNFDTITIDDWLDVCKALTPGSTGTDAAKAMEIIKRCTNTEIGKLPLSELQNVLIQFTSELAYHLKNILGKERQ